MARRTGVGSPAAGGADAVPVLADVDREQVLAYRVAAQGLHRDGGDDPAGLAVLDLGLQDSMFATTTVALAARLPALPRRPLPEAGLARAWTLRGAPHWHRASELPAVAAATWPFSEADAVTRLSWDRRRVAAADMPALRAIETVAEAVRVTVTAPTSKGAVSAAVTARIPPGLSLWCRGCGATHVHEQLLRLAALPGGAGLDPDASTAVLAPIPGWPGPPDAPEGTGRLIEAYLRVLGPAGPAEVASFLGSTARTIAAVWPGGLVEVRVEGRRAWLPQDAVETLRHPPDPDPVRLLPPWDPFLQARDRGLLLPDVDRQKEVFRIIGNPGALLVDGEVAGTWRPRKSGRRLTVAVTAFHRLGTATRAAVEEEAAVVAGARDATDVRVEILT